MLHETEESHDRQAHALAVDKDEHTRAVQQLVDDHADRVAVRVRIETDDLFAPLLATELHIDGVYEPLR